MQLPITRDGVGLVDAHPGGAQIAQGFAPQFAPEVARSAPLEPTPEAEQDATYRTHRRFDRAARLFSEPGLHRLMASHVVVVGVGGVGSFAAESLARSGVGKLTLVDFDKVCITNSNRQLHAMQGTIGKRKVDVMKERLRLVSPSAEIVALPEFYSAETSEGILQGPIDFVVDAIDNLKAKGHLVAQCLRRGIPVVSSMGAAAKMDPTQVRVADLSKTHHDPFASALRRILRTKHGFEFGKRTLLGVHAVFSPEEATLPSAPGYDGGEGFRCVCPGGKNGRYDCDRRPRIDGSASFVTGTFGLVMASVVVRTLIANETTHDDECSSRAPHPPLDLAVPASSAC